MDRYEEALERAKKNYRTAQDLCDGSQIGVECFKNTLTSIFPELKESEDEKIKETLIDYFKTYKKQEECGIKTFFGIPTDNILAWLEKQGEQKELSQSKVTKISDQDDDLDALGQAIYAIESFVVEDKPNKCFAGHHVPFIKAIEILKSLKQRLAL